MHEIKFDGYRLQLHTKEGQTRLYTRRGYDWTHRFAVIAEAAWSLKSDKGGHDLGAGLPTPESLMANQPQGKLATPMGSHLSAPNHCAA